MAMSTVQRRRFLFLPLIKKISLFHVTNYGTFSGLQRSYPELDSWFHQALKDSSGNVQEEETKTVSRSHSGQGTRSGEGGPTSCREDCDREKEKTGETQAHARKTSGGSLAGKVN